MALMITEQRDVTTTGAQQVKAFSIKANGKAFKVLIDGLYSDKIKSVIRELWTNAYDAHVMADNTEQPFECHLPTVFEPHFAVRDFGISMTHSGVMNLYSTVFESSKEGTNEQVGKLGLGSKSPFAYTDTFTVTAWMDGEKRLYSAFIGSDYIPQIAHMSTESSDEPEGLEVSFPVKQADIEAFHTAAEKVIIGFETRPIITGAKLNTAPMEEHKRGENWVLYKEAWNGAITEPHARQGCVLYPLDADAIQGLSLSQRDLLDTPIVINFPIGSLEITANREGLGYDKTTCANIVAELDAIIDALSVEFIDKLNSAETVWDALVIRKQIMDDTSIPKFIRDRVRTAVFAGIPLEQRSDWMSWRGLCRSDIFIAKLDEYEMHRRKAGPKIEKSNVHRTGGVHFTPGTVRVYLHDPDTKVPGHAMRIMNHYTAHRYEANAPSKFIYVRAKKNSIGFKRLLVKMGRPPADIFVDVATLPEIPKERLMRSVVKMKLITPYEMRPDDVDFDAGGFYVPMMRDNLDQIPAPFNAYNNNCSVATLFADLRELGIIPAGSKLHGMPKSLSRHASKDQWVNFWDIAKVFFDTHFDADRVGNISKANKILNPDGLYSGNEPKLLRACLALDLLGLAPDDQTKPLGVLLSSLSTVRALTLASKEQRLIERHLRMTKFEATPFDAEKQADTIRDQIADVYSAYPMVAKVAKTGSGWADIFNPTSNADAKTVLDYVNLIDRQ